MQPELSPRQSEILELLVEAVPQKIIAEKLGISAKTVNSYISNTAEKLGYESATKMVHDVIRQRTRAEVAK